MKLILSLITFIILNYSYSQSNAGCINYKTGKFEVLNGNGSRSIIKRSKKYQTEKSNGIKIKDKIVWIDDCTYKLVPKKLKDNSGVIETEVLIFKFIETYDHYYIVEVRAESNADAITTAKVYEYGYLSR